MYTVVPLLTGVRNPDQGIMTYQRDYGKPIWLPIYALLVCGAGRTILVDTGLDEDEAMVPAGFAEQTGLSPLPLTEALAAHGVAPEDVDTVINTHLHDDHCGNNRLFPGATHYVQQSELEFQRNPHPLDHRYDEYFTEGIQFHTLDGDAEPVPGIRCLLTPGHTPGCQTVVIPTASGDVALSGQCCNEKNFPDNGPAICPGVHTDALAAYDSMQRIKALDARILPTHGLSVATLRF